MPGLCNSGITNPSEMISWIFLICTSTSAVSKPSQLVRSNTHSLTLQLIWPCLCLTQIFLIIVIGPYASYKFKAKQQCPNIWDISNGLKSCWTLVLLSYLHTCAWHIFIVHSIQKNKWTTLSQSVQCNQLCKVKPSCDHKSWCYSSNEKQNQWNKSNE
jgi:hypothetical protein